MTKLDKENEALLKAIEKDIKAIYIRAQVEIAHDWHIFETDFKLNDRLFTEEIKAAREAGDWKRLQYAEYEYRRFLFNSANTDNRFRNMLEQVKAELLNANQTAADYMNGRVQDVYILNYNGETSRLFKESKLFAASVGGETQAYFNSVSWELLNPHTVKRLIMDKGTRLPYKEVDGVKYERWATKKINAQLTQAILRGEGVRSFADRLMKVTVMDREAATRNARTMFTAAQNAGRLDSMKSAEEKGVIVEKTWVSIEDARTRESHVELDGVSVPLDEKFSNGLEYPGDPNGAPEEVYNCRCDLHHEIKGFRPRITGGFELYVDEKKVR